MKEPKPISNFHLAKLPAQSLILVLVFFHLFFVSSGVDSELSSSPVFTFSVSELLLFRLFVGFVETVPGTANPINSQLQASQSK
jgi:hypothetical protein